MFYLFYLEFIILGIIVGALTGVLGSSGVVAVVPALIIINSELPQDAIGTSLLIDVITSVMVAYVYFKRGKEYIFLIIVWKQFNLNGFKHNIQI